MAFILFNSQVGATQLFSLTIISLVVLLILWIFFDTKYELIKNHLKYKSGPIRGEIEIHRIRKIIKGKTLWVGLKPATAKNGLIIKYNKYDEIYISPKTNDVFIAEILELNSEIEIE
ncbi:MAG: PH domain-containing protein [Flavobacteriaceae bacterium]